jgi:nucleotide-binding universal stress UspA family protein
MMVDVYRNVIVPFDGSLTGRVVLAPASDLAWRCGAHVVVVSNTDAGDRSSQAAVKLQAMAKSGNDVEFWIDLDRSLAESALTAVSYREDPLLCVASPRSHGALRRWRRPGVGQLAGDVLARATVPTLVVGPVADVGRGLAMTELVVVVDGTPSADTLVKLAAEWAAAFKLRLVLTAVLAPGQSMPRPELQQYVDQRVDALEAPGGVTSELLADEAGVEELVASLHRRHDAVALVMANHGKAGALGSFASSLVIASPRPVLVGVV